MYSLENIEKKQNIKFPEAYQILYQSNFKAIGKRMEMHVGNDIFKIRKFLTATEMFDILDEFYDLFGYDIIPIAEADYDDYICLYYRKNMKQPSIIYWDYELALENPEKGILLLCEDMHEFEFNLK